MNPISINPVALIGAGIIFLGGLTTGWAINGWRLNTEIAEIKAERADDKAKQSAAALDDIKKSSAVIAGAAQDFGTLQRELGAKIAQLKKEKHETALPPDCKPDSGRMRILAAAVDATNEAAAGLKISRTLPADR